ncbi:MAG: hypothetical protein EVA42_03905 [Flavobacteriales bacterium]|nr:MAG: hypothetical protein EVA42_03905 [Flavobacteriales bacterium]
MKSKIDIISASAGSGKTHVLTKQILKKILKSKDKEYYKRILALTFTNKATQEMKERVLSSLKEFSKVEKPKDSELYFSIKNELELSDSEIRLKAKEILQKILHDFSFFQIDTIDSFNHQLLRSFAHDLNISSDFNLITETEDVIDEAIARVFQSAVNDSNKLNMLKAFAFDKINEGKSWDIGHDLKEFARSLFNENQFNDIQNLNTHSLESFKELKKELLKKEAYETKKQKEILKAIQTVIENKSFEISFSRNSFPKFVKKVLENQHTWKEVSSVFKLFEKETLINKSSYKTHPIICKQVFEELKELFLNLKKSLENCFALKSFSNSIIPSLLIKTIKKYFKEIQKEKNQISISEFNEIIYKEILNQPTPYIYEKIGVRFNDYFIDEFQDTSLLQWANIIPLISHALDSYDHDDPEGSLLVVGDPKQSVYRWRGANPRIFTDLLEGENPFNAKKNIKFLPKNYRSKKEIIIFNNLFFKSISKLLSNKSHKHIFEESSSQKTNDKKGGYVSLKFLKQELNKEEYLSETIDSVCSIIIDCKKRNYKNSEISILTRDNNQSSQISRGLIERGISVSSEDALLLSNSKEVMLLIELIKLRIDPTNKRSKFKIANHFYNPKLKEDQFLFFNSIINLDQEGFLKKINLEFLSEGFKKPLFNSITLAIKELKLNEQNNNIFISFFLEILYDQVYKKSQSDEEFLRYWDKNKEKIKVSGEGNKESVQVLTIHKAKGLEFPVVIYPFADSFTFRTYGLKKWFPVDKSKNPTKLLVSFNEKLKEYNDLTKNMVETTLENQELDNTNLLYVAFTRAVDELYTISSFPKKASLNSHNEITRSFLETNKIWNEEKLNYSWGTKTVKKSQTKTKTVLNKGFQTTQMKFEPKRSYVDEKINFGLYFHEFMGKIKKRSDYNREKTDLDLNQTINKEIKNQILSISKKIVTSPSIKKHFSPELRVLCEKEIFSNDGRIFKPDRIVFDKNQVATVIDYKTGQKSRRDVLQIENYKKLLQKMGYKVRETILVYVNNQYNDIEIVVD